MNYKFWLPALLLVMLCPAPVLGAGVESAASFLLLGHGARGPALAGAVVARPEGALAARYNPAGLARLSGTRLETAFQDLVMGARQGGVDYVSPGPRGGRALSFNYVNYGSEERVEISTSGEPVEAGSFTSVEGSLGYLEGMLWERGATYDWYWGGGGRLLRVNVADASDHSVAGEVGFLAVARRGNYQFGGVLRNLGPKVELDGTGEPLPRLVRLGVSSVAYADGRNELFVNFETELRRLEEFSGFLSAELRSGRHLALRAGYDGRVDAGPGLRFGFGLNKAGTRFDYAYLPTGDLGDSHRFSVNFEFQ